MLESIPKGYEHLNNVDKDPCQGNNLEAWHAGPKSQ